jgi:hypothetical protein
VVIVRARTLRSCIRRAICTNRLTFLLKLFKVSLALCLKCITYMYCMMIRRREEGYSIHTMLILNNRPSPRMRTTLLGDILHSQPSAPAHASTRHDTIHTFCLVPRNLPIRNHETLHRHPIRCNHPYPPVSIPPSCTSFSGATGERQAHTTFDQQPVSPLSSPRPGDAPNQLAFMRRTCHYNSISLVPRHRVNMYSSLHTY